MYRSSAGILLFALLQGAAAAQYTLTSDGCVDASGFDSCFSQATDEANTCYSQNCNADNGECQGIGNCQSSDPNCVGACVAVAYQSWINCAISHCWNKAYSCEYQNLVIQAVIACGEDLNIVFPPYFANATTNQPGACSCQLGQLYSTFRNSVPQTNACRNRATSASVGNSCTCCGSSHALSSFADVCPDIDPQTLPFYSSLDISDAVSALNSNLCNNLLPSQGAIDCTADPLDFAMYNNGPFYGFSDLPQTGSLSATDQSGSLTAPLSETLVWSLISGNPPVTAVAASASGTPAAAGSSGSSGSKVTGGSGAATATSKTTGAAASQFTLSLSSCLAASIAVALFFSIL